MKQVRANWMLIVGLAVGTVVGLGAGSLLSGREALAQGGAGGKPVGIAIFKDTSDINARPQAYILYDSGKVERKPLASLGGG